MVETTIEDLIISGCDERIALNGANYTNRYFLNPFHFEQLLHRGSCTASTLDSITLKLLEQTDIQKMEAHFQEVVNAHADRIKKLLYTPGGTSFEVFFAPSGSDLAYFPILFKQVLKGNAHLINMLTCPEELGSGTKLASNGLYHAETNQFDDATIKGGNISGIPEPELLELNGRNEAGKILDNHRSIIEAIDRYSDQEIIVNLVYGSKSGIEDNLKVLEDLTDDRILCTVDLCQFRNSKHLVQYLLSHNCIIYLTGSKFYQAPPFCGCMLVPEKICVQLENGDATPAKEFSRLFSMYDVPDRFKSLREQLPNYKNLGLHLRWMCALYEMEAFDGIDEKQTSGIIEEWNSLITKKLADKQCFELMPDMELTNKSIISFRVKNDVGYLDYDALWELFERVVNSEYDQLGNFRKVFIGQPVRYDSGSFLRVALGARNVISLLQIPLEKRYLADLQLIDILENEVAYA